MAGCRKLGTAMSAMELQESLRDANDSEMAALDLLNEEDHINLDAMRLLPD